nr:MAG TPA: hypothetical protein [Caudoviricetes sp.]
MIVELSQFLRYTGGRAPLFVHNRPVINIVLGCHFVPHKIVNGGFLRMQLTNLREIFVYQSVTCQFVPYWCDCTPFSVHDRTVR